MIKLLFLVVLCELASSQNLYGGNFWNTEQGIYKPISTTATTRRTLTTTRRTTTKGPHSGQDEPCALDEQCVDWYSCGENQTPNKNEGAFLIDARFDSSFPNEVICESMENCCKTEGETPPVTQAPSITEEPPSETSSLKPTTVRPTTVKPFVKPYFPTPKKCGFRNINGLGGHISNTAGKDIYAQYAEFPWMMAILTFGKTREKYHGGGSLIHPKVVVTAAHIISQAHPNKLRVRGGEYNAQNKNELFPQEDRKVENKIMHDDFSEAEQINNIALLVLTEGFKLSAYINTICLPPAKMTFEDERCFASGWGKEKFEKGKAFQTFLKKVELPIIERQNCIEMLEKIKLYESNLELGEKTLCAGGEVGIDMCTGDGGGPLMCFLDEHFYLVGLVTHGVFASCGTEGYPGFYEDVAKHRKWIDEQIGTISGANRTYYLP